MKSIKVLLTLPVLTFLVACAAVPVSPEPEAKVELADRIYFDFDQSDIKPEWTDLLDQHADAIKKAVEKDPNLVIRIEGHCDERGTVDYNFALGNRRAEAVSRYLRVKGIAADNLITESYGEERPEVNEANEEAWAKNRRAVFVY